jgi:NCS1 family nucleobase:cation symporter-1
VLCKVWPVQIYPTEHQSSESTAWETMVPTEGFFQDDETMPEYVKNRVLFGVEPTTTVSSEEENVRRGSVEEKKRPSAV